jgi:hypothetical protein
MRIDSGSGVLADTADKDILLPEVTRLSATV